MNYNTQYKNILPLISEKISADEASEEFSYTWLDLETMDYGIFYKTKLEAVEAAKDNYHGFCESMAGSQVAIIKICEILTHNEEYQEEPPIGKDYHNRNKKAYGKDYTDEADKLFNEIKKGRANSL
jgi:hypothetical protein